MNRAPSRVTRLLLERRARALKRHLPAAIEGDGIGVHQARVASRRLREAVPVLARDVKPGKARKAQRQDPQADAGPRGRPRARRHADGARRARRARHPADASRLEEVRAHVVEEREHRRATMLKRLEKVKVDKLDRRLASVAEALQEAESEKLAGRAGGATGEAVEGARGGHR